MKKPKTRKETPQPPLEIQNINIKAEEMVYWFLLLERENKAAVIEVPPITKGLCFSPVTAGYLKPSMTKGRGQV